MEQRSSSEAVEHSPMHISKQITHTLRVAVHAKHTHTAGREAARAKAQQLIPVCERAKRWPNVSSILPFLVFFFFNRV